MVTKTESTVKFDAFVEEHEYLERAFDELHALLIRRQSPIAVCAACDKFGDHVKTHFAHESQVDGFFDNVIDQAPRLKERANALIGEHSDMLTALAELQSHASCTSVSDHWWSEMNDRTEAFWRMFCRHERAEIELVQDAFYDDIGAAD